MKPTMAASGLANTRHAVSRLGRAPLFRKMHVARWLGSDMNPTAPRSLVSALETSLIALAVFSTGGFLVILPAGDIVTLLFGVNALLLILVRKRIRLRAASAAWGGVLILGVAAATVANWEPSTARDGIGMIAKIGLAYIGVVSLAGTPVRALAHKLVMIISLLAAVSLVTFVLSNVFPSLLVRYADGPLNNHYLTWLGVTYARSKDIAKYGFLRNQSIFWEPGVFGVMLVVGWVVRRWALGVRGGRLLYGLSVLSTMATGSMILLLGTWMMEAFGLDRSASRRSYAALALLFLVAVGIAVALYDGRGMPSSVNRGLDVALQRNVSDDSSIKTRIDDLVYGSLAVPDKPVVGHSGDYDDYYRILQANTGKTKSFYNGGITNGIVDAAYRYGVVWLGVFLFGLWTLARRITKAFSFGIFALLVGILMYEPLYGGVACLASVMLALQP